MKGKFSNLSLEDYANEALKRFPSIFLNFNSSSGDIFFLVLYSAYGAVYKAIHTDTSLTVAIKKVKLAGSKHTREEIKKEIDVLKKCRHFNIVSYWGCCFYEEELWVLHHCSLILRY